MRSYPRCHIKSKIYLKIEQILKNVKIIYIYRAFYVECGFSLIVTKLMNLATLNIVNWQNNRWMLATTFYPLDAEIVAII